MAREEGRRRGLQQRGTANECGVSFVSDENALNLDYSDDCTTLNILKSIKLYTLVNFMTCKLYFSKDI